MLGWIFLFQIIPDNLGFLCLYIKPTTFIKVIWFHIFGPMKIFSSMTSWCSKWKVNKSKVSWILFNVVNGSFCTNPFSRKRYFINQHLEKFGEEECFYFFYIQAWKFSWPRFSGERHKLMCSTLRKVILFLLIVQHAFTILTRQSNEWFFLRFGKCFISIYVIACNIMILNDTLYHGLS